MARWWFLVVGSSLALCFLASASFAQPPIPGHPSGRRGLDPSTPYQLGDFDGVNLFTGSLFLNIPILAGQVDGGLSYGLALRYNSDMWDHEQRFGDQRRAHPNPDHNAGLGWMMTFGMLYEPLAHPIHTDNHNYILVDTDGARRIFTSSLHPGDPQVANVFYTRDGSYLRLKIDQPNVGERTVESMDGSRRIFDSLGRVTRIEDPFGNYLDILYSQTRWTLRDQHYTAQNGREHFVDFAEVCPGFPRQVDRVDMAAFGGARAVYQFEYRTPCPAIPRYRDSDPQSSATVVVPLLESVSVPDGHGSQYQMMYSTTSGPFVPDPEGTWSAWPCSPPCLELNQNQVTIGGQLTSLTLPTQGRYEWQYRKYYFNLPRYLDFPTDTILGEVVGVAYKRKFHASGQEEGRWRYIQGPRPNHEAPEPQFSQEMRTWVTDPEGNVSVHYFFDAEEEFQDPSRVSDWRHGRPFAMQLLDGNRQLSRRVYEGEASLANLRRTEFVRYTADQLASSSSGNHRLESTKTFFNDDSPRFAEVTYSKFDGLGHYRKAVTGGNFGASNVRETLTNFNPDAGIYDYNRHILSSGPDGIGTFVPPGAGDPWILGTFDERSATEAGFTQAQQYCFNTQGFLLRSRMLAEISANPSPRAAGSECPGERVFRAQLRRR